MKGHKSWLAIGLVALSAALTGCAAGQVGTATSTLDKPGTLVPGDGTERSHVALTPGTAERIGLKTDQVREVLSSLAGESAPAKHLALPMAAVFYDKTGATWVYAKLDALNYIRRPVRIGKIDADMAVLQTGPGAGTAVVTVGSAQLMGVEDGVEGE
jgi:hypothetical protein